jgi:hypothetical protein
MYAAIAPHGGGRVLQPTDAVNAGADDLVRDETRREGVRESARASAAAAMA